MRLILLISFLLSPFLAAQTKVACVGDSITFGAGIQNRAENSYPAQLQKMLGAKYEVRNFGVSARTMLNNGDRPYTKEKTYRDSLDFTPDIVIIKLGTNDSKPMNWKFKDEFLKDAKALVRSYLKLSSKPRIILCLPAPVIQERWEITEKILREEVAPLVSQTARQTKSEVLDLHPVLVGKKDWFPDGIHPNADGAKAMAKVISQRVKKK